MEKNLEIQLPRSIGVSTCQWSIISSVQLKMWGIEFNKKAGSPTPFIPIILFFFQVSPLVKVTPPMFCDRSTKEFFPKLMNLTQLVDEKGSLFFKQ